MVGVLSNAQIFSNFQCSISLLCLKIELRVSLLTYRNSYFIYHKNIFSMTLNFSFKIKLHMRKALPYFAKQGNKIVTKYVQNFQKFIEFFCFFPFWRDGGQISHKFAT